MDDFFKNISRKNTYTKNILNKNNIKRGINFVKGGICTIKHAMETTNIGNINYVLWYVTLAIELRKELVPTFSCG